MATGLQRLDDVEVVHGLSDRVILEEVNVRGADFHAEPLRIRPKTDRASAKSEGQGGACGLICAVFEQSVSGDWRGLCGESSPGDCPGDYGSIQRGNAHVELMMRGMDVESVELTAEEGSHITRVPYTPRGRPSAAKRS